MNTKLAVRKIKTSELIDRALSLGAEKFKMFKLDLNLSIRFDDSGQFMVWFDKAIFTPDGNTYQGAMPIFHNRRESPTGTGMTINQALLDLMRDIERV